MGIGSWQFPNQQALDRPSARDAIPQQPRGKNAGIVQDKEVACLQVVRELSENRVVQRPG